MLFGPGPDWNEDGQGWPNRAASQFVESGGLRWHVQRMGQGPVVVLVHGTGAATHSWRDVMPLLSQRFTVVAMDLPGHGFTEMPAMDRMTLPAMARGVGGLLRTLGLRPELVAGHSAGAAILARMALDGLAEPKALLALNGAFLPFREGQGHLFSGLAKLLFLNPLVPRLFAWRAGDRNSVDRLIRDTGSVIDARGAEAYSRLLRRPGHVSAALGMMAGWDLHALLADLPALPCRLVLLAGTNDRAVPAAQAARVAGLVPGAQVERVLGLGHLAHEERPQLVADLVGRLALETGTLAPAT